MIEFESVGDVMVFDCVTFRIEVAPGWEHIEFKEAGKEIPDTESLIQSAFKVLGMMLEHNVRQTNFMKDDFDIHDARKRIIELTKKRRIVT